MDFFLKSLLGFIDFLTRFCWKVSVEPSVFEKGLETTQIGIFKQASPSKEPDGYDKNVKLLGKTHKFLQISMPPN